VSMTTALSGRGIEHRLVGDETLFDLVFTDRNVRDYRDTAAADKARGAAFAKALLAHGVLKPPGKTYPSLALSEADLSHVDRAVAAAADALLAA